MKRFLVITCTTVTLAWAILHLAGARADIGVLSGSEGNLVLGLAYALTYFAVVIVVPIVLLALLFDLTCGRLVRWRRTRAR